MRSEHSAVKRDTQRTSPAPQPVLREKKFERIFSHRDHFCHTQYDRNTPDIFAYLKQYNRSKIVFGDSLPEIDESRFHVCDWTEFYPDAKEALPPDIPKPQEGKKVQLTCFVAADRAGC